MRAVRAVVLILDLGVSIETVCMIYQLENSQERQEGEQRTKSGKGNGSCCHS